MQDPLVGKRLREYAILELVGKGGTAKVYKARHVLLDELRAIKILRPELCETKELNDRFRREAKILLRLRERHLVTVYEFGILGRDNLFMVMEFLEGESLRARLSQTLWLHPSEAIEIAKQVALGLSRVHDKGVVHRDVSPDNIVLVPTEDGEDVKLIDFGIAKNVLAPLESKITGTLTFVGKAAYCSPEQIKLDGRGDDVDGRSDIYSLGVTLYELLTGSLPFRGDNPQAYVTQHLSAPPMSMYEANPLVRVPRALEKLVARMMDKHRDERPQSMREVLIELSALADEKCGATTLAVQAPFAV